MINDHGKRVFFRRWLWRIRLRLWIMDIFAVNVLVVSHIVIRERLDHDVVFHALDAFANRQDSVVRS